MGSREGEEIDRWESEGIEEEEKIDRTEEEKSIV